MLQTRKAVAVLVGATLLISACSGSTSTPASTAPVSPRTSSPASTAPTSGPPLVLEPALLTVANARGFHATRITTSSAQALPCTPHAPGLAAQYPPQTKAGVAFQSRSLKASFQETLLGYPNAAAVDDVYAAAQDGYNCAGGNIDGLAAGIARVGARDGQGYRSQRWDYRLANGALGTTVVAQYGRVLITVDFLAVSGGSGEIDPDTVLQAALALVAADATG